MRKPNGCEWGIYFDDVHIITVNYAREEARLYENGGSGEGRLLAKKDDSAAKVPVNEPLLLIHMAFQFAVSYELLSQIADEKALAFFEHVGAKEFLERVVSVTTEEDRRGLINGLGPKFTSFNTSSGQPQTQRQAAGVASSNSRGKSGK